MDERIKVLAKNLVNYSMAVKPGDKVYIRYCGPETKDLARQVIKEIYKVGAFPFPHYEDTTILREVLLNCTEEQMKLRAEIDQAEMKAMDCYLSISGGENAAELTDVPAEKREIYDKYYMQPVHMETRLKTTRWTVMRYPNYSMAQLSNMSLEAFEDYYFNVCNLDYSKMNKAMESLVNYMNRTDKVRIVGKGTDLSFSIKDIPTVPCAGEMNIPDGEVYTAPVKDSVNGVLHYTAPSLYKGFTFEDITLTFENGKIVKATSNDTERINKIFDTDEGARYVGEFAIGVNPYITTPMKDTLFDEKIMGSIHFTPGNSYDDAPNGNHSAIHWDLVCIQTPEYGGGEIYFDDVLIRKDGLFVVDELKCLNPDQLV